MGIPLPNVEVCNPQVLAVNLSNSSGVQFNSPGTANTKGAWSQLIAKTSADIDLLLVYIEYNDNSNYSWAIDIGIGPSGSEVALIPNLLMANNSNSTGLRIAIPVFIPAGTRIATRSQCTVTTTNYNINLIGFSGSNGYAGVDALGLNLSSATTGTQLAFTAGSQNSMGAYTQIVAATARDYVGIFILVADPGTASGQYVFDVAVGASGNEQNIVSNVVMNLTGGLIGHYLPFVNVRIPAGSRIVMRQQHNSNGDSAGAVYAVYGVF